jgi:hypothetical protein
MAKRPKRHHARHVLYQPSDEARRFVLAMAGLGMTTDSIRCVIDPRMSKTTFYRAFRDELQNGSAHMHALVASKLKQAVENGAPWAIMLSARNLPQFRWDRSGKDGLVLPPGGGVDGIQISFVSPSKPAEPVDVTPPSPYPADAQPDYTRQAIEPPRQRERTAFGIVEQPRSVFDRGSNDDWMK